MIRVDIQIDAVGEMLEQFFDVGHVAGRSIKQVYLTHLEDASLRTCA